MKREILINKISTYLDCSLDMAKLYMTLLEKPYTINEMDNTSEKVSKYLEILMSQCLISEYIDERSGGQKVYFAIDPRYSLSAILLNEAWNRDSELHSIDVLKNRTDIPDLYNKYLLCNDISTELQDVYKRQLPYIKEIVIIVKGKKKIASCLAEQISDVRKNILAMVSPPQLMGEIVWQTIRDKMFDGIKYNRITDFNEIIRHGFEIACLEIEKYNEDIYIFTKDVLPEKFYILDNQSVIFFEKSKDRKNYLQKIQIIKNVGVATQFIGRYNAILSNSIDFRTLIPKIRNYREKVIQMAKISVDSDIVMWLIDIFDNGVFYSKGKYRTSFIEHSIDVCREKGFVRVLDDETVVVNYGMKDILSA